MLKTNTIQPEPLVEMSYCLENKDGEIVATKFSYTPTT